MSPARPSSRRNSSGAFKPYTRCVTPIVVPPTSDVTSQDLNASRNTERPGFPSYAQYKQVENSYIQSLTPRRQGKALISQAMFDRIWDVLHQPEAQGETAQFRFWARKMFTLSKTHRLTLGGNVNFDEPPQEVLLHDNLLVAVQEQLYDLLCYCHGSTGHGGRDKTCALVRKHYTWVPKDLVSNFIKACPTCILKKCGNFDSSPLPQTQTSDSKIGGMSVPALREFYHNICNQENPAAPSSSSPGVAWPSMSDPRNAPASPILLEDDPLEAAYREAILRARGLKTLAGLGVPTPRGLQSHHMSREVSLYKGLPNGWQYRHNDYASAHAEFMRTKDQPVMEDPDIKNPRPRVPSIAPLWGPDAYPHPEYHGLEQEEHVETQASFHSTPACDQEGDTRPSLQYLIMCSQQQDRGPAIDPVLMALSTEGSYEHHDNQTTEGQLPEDENVITSSHTSPTSMKRNVAPLRLNLGSLPTERSFQALLAYRDSLSEGSETPDSPMLNWHPGNPSPASSMSSCGSQLTAFPMSATSSISPPNSCLPTPVDEYCTDPAGHLDKGKGRLALPEATEMELTASIDAVCGL